MRAENPDLFPIFFMVNSPSDAQSERLLSGIVRKIVSSNAGGTSVVLETPLGAEVTVLGVPAADCPKPRQEVEMRIQQIDKEVRYVCSERVLCGSVHGTSSGAGFTRVDLETAEEGIVAVEAVPTAQCPDMCAKVALRVQQTRNGFRFLGFEQVPQKVALS